MEFGAIQRISPLPPVTGPRSPSDVNQVFAAEFNRQQGRKDESREESRRGLEEEDPEIELEAETDSAELAEQPAGPGQPSPRLNLFA